MRAQEFLIEKVITPRDFYKKDRLDVFISRLEKGEPFKNNDTGKDVIITPTNRELYNLKSLLKMYDDNGAFPGGTAGVGKYVPNTIGGVQLNSLFKDPGLGGRGGTKGDSEDTGSGNIGPAVELWKSAAIYTRLIHREPRPITFEDIQTIVKELDANKELIKKQNTKTQTVLAKVFKLVPDFNKKIQDTLSLKIDIGLGPYQRAIALTQSDTKLWGTVQAVISFINENLALKKYTQIFAMNGRVDPIKVALVGGEGAKTDIKTTYIDPETDSAKPLSHLNFSVKAGSSLFHQSSGTTNEGVEIMFESLGLSLLDANDAIEQTKFQQKPRMKKGEVEKPTIVQNRQKALEKIIGIAADKLNYKLRSINDGGEQKFIINFLEGLKKAFTGDQNLIYVDFNPNGTYKKLNPYQIGNLAELVDLECRLLRKGTLYLYIYDAISNKNLFHLRLLKANSGRLAIIFELDNLVAMTVNATKVLNSRQSAVTPTPQQPNVVKTPKTNSAKFAEPVPAPYPKKPEPAQKVGEPMGAPGQP
jgi:hypothetical protein